MTGRVHTDHEIVQEALGYGGDYMPSATLRDEARAALGRLVEALHTAQQPHSQAGAERSRADRLEVQFAELRAERDTAIRERDEARATLERAGSALLEDKLGLAQQERDAYRARLERVEAALREIEGHATDVMLPSHTACFKIAGIAHAALSDVTPPSERCSACGAPGTLLDEVQECPAIKRDSAGTCLWKARSAAGAVDE